MKKSSISLANKIALAFTLLGILILVGCSVYWKLHKAVALDLPIKIHKGTFLAEEFKTSFSDKYEVNLYIEKSCGMTEACLTSAPELTITVSESGSVIATDRIFPASPSSWSGDEVGFRLGTFNAKAGEQYKVEISSSRDATEMEAPKPRVNVALNHGYYKDLFVSTSLLQYGALLLLAIAALIFLGNFIFKKVTIRRKSN